MNKMTASHFRQHMKAAVDEVTANHEVLQVTRRWEEDFVVVSASDWQAIVETLRLNQVPDLVDSILEAASEPLEQAIELEDLKR